MIYTGIKTQQISLPLGGIGSGSIGLAGNGSLIDWQIFNRPDKGRRNGLSHFLVRTERNGKVCDLRVLNGDLLPPYEGTFRREYEGCCLGPGFGPADETLAGWPHFRTWQFDGRFPFGTLAFGDEKFPGKCTLTGWSVLIPGDENDSSLPAAFFEIEIENNTQESLDYTVVGVLGNPWEGGITRYNRLAGNQVTVFQGDDAEAFDYGELTLTCLERPENLSGQESLLRGARWRDAQEVYLNDLLAGGRLINRTYDKPPAFPCREAGVMACHFRLEAGSRRKTVFIITWHIPFQRNDWASDADDSAAAACKKNLWKNYYATCWKNSRSSGLYAQQHYKRLLYDTQQLADALWTTTLPPAMLNGIVRNLAILKSPTCLRLEDGTFYGWEGTGAFWGSCEGSCTHVWNYAQAPAFLFPALERSMRESHLKFGVDEYGGSHFRLKLPLGIKAQADWFCTDGEDCQHPCADGQFGEVMKVFRDWKISGDSDWLKARYPIIRQMISYAWNEHNPDHWDPEMTGILIGRQHHTLDMQLFGANSWLTGFYHGALLAGAVIAEVCGDLEFAALCRQIHRRGKDWLENNLYNGEYYIQKIDLADKSLLDYYGSECHDCYWSSECKQIKYQVAGGCLIDATVAQWFARLYGIGEIFETERNRRTLEAIMHYNFRINQRGIIGLWRLFSLNDESGCSICTWPSTSKPAVPLPYHSETMPGFEWTLAAHLLAAGLTQESQRLAEALEDRFDGEKRNPYSEFECGYGYARSLASYGVLIAASGFRYDLSQGMIGFHPYTTHYFRSFWSLGKKWGIYEQTPYRVSLTLLGEEMTLSRIELDREVVSLKRNCEPLEFAFRSGSVIFKIPCHLHRGERLIFQTSGKSGSDGGDFG